MPARSVRDAPEAGFARYLALRMKRYWTGCRPASCGGLTSSTSGVRRFEHPFGSIKQWMNQGAFLMRGLQKVRAEISVTALAYNLRRVLNIVGFPALMQAHCRPERLTSEALLPNHARLQSPMTLMGSATSPIGRTWDLHQRLVVRLMSSTSPQNRVPTWSAGVAPVRRHR